MIPGEVMLPPRMAEKAVKENWPYYRCMLGCHEEKVLPEERTNPDDTLSSLKAVRIKMGDVFRSPLNLLAHNRGGFEKFQLLVGMNGNAGNLPVNPNQEVWDRSQETLEQFVERQKQRQHAHPLGVASVMPQAVQEPHPAPASASQAAIPSSQEMAPGVPSSPLPPHAQVDLAEYDERKLREIAASEEVDVSRCRSKADLVSTLRKALGGKQKR